MKTGVGIRGSLYILLSKLTYKNENELFKVHFRFFVIKINILIIYSLSFLM